MDISEEQDEKALPKILLRVEGKYTVCSDGLYAKQPLGISVMPLGMLAHCNALNINILGCNSSKKGGKSKLLKEEQERKDVAAILIRVLPPIKVFKAEQL